MQRVKQSKKNDYDPGVNIGSENYKIIRKAGQGVRDDTVPQGVWYEVIYAGRHRQIQKATVYVSYKNKKYSNKCDNNGIYRIVLDKEMEKGVKFKIWQSDGKRTSKKASYRVTSEL